MNYRHRWTVRSGSRDVQLNVHLEVELCETPWIYSGMSGLKSQ